MVFHSSDHEFIEELLLATQNLKTPDGALLKKLVEHILPREFYFFKVTNNTKTKAFNSSTQKIERVPLKWINLKQQEKQSSLVPLSSFCYLKLAQREPRYWMRRIFFLNGRTIDPDRSNPDKLEVDELKIKYDNDKANKGLNKNGNVKNYVPKTLCVESLNLNAPNVTIKYSDILLAFKDELEGVHPAGKDDRWQQYAKTNSGQIPATNEEDVTFRVLLFRRIVVNDKANKRLNKYENVKNYVPKGIMEMSLSLRRSYILQIRLMDETFNNSVVYPVGKGDRWQQYAKLTLDKSRLQAKLASQNLKTPDGAPLKKFDPDRSNPDKLEADEWKNKYGSFHSSGYVFIARIV
ncbi:18310_t:CDS:10, partial [Gigaspora rosea]